MLLPPESKCLNSVSLTKPLEGLLTYIEFFILTPKKQISILNKKKNFFNEFKDFTSQKKRKINDYVSTGYAIPIKSDIYTYILAIFKMIPASGIVAKL